MSGPTPMDRPGVPLVRDGTIIADSGRVGSVERVQFLDGAIEAIAALNRAGLRVAVTNQAAAGPRPVHRRRRPPGSPASDRTEGPDLTTRAFSLSTKVELFGAKANDHGSDPVIQHQLPSLASPGDVLVAVSSSGRSLNIVRTLEWADRHRLCTIALTGFAGCGARELATVSEHVDSDNHGIVEDAHQACIHFLAQYARQLRIAPDDVTRQHFLRARCA